MMESARYTECTLTERKEEDPSAKLLETYDDSIPSILTPYHPTEYSRSISLKAWAIHGTLLLFSASLLLLNIMNEFPSNTSNPYSEIAWSPIVDAILPQSVKFNESFFFPDQSPSRFRGDPGSKVDREWDKFTKHPMIDGTQGTLAVPKETILKMEKASDREWLNSVVRLQHNGEERYMASLEIFHQVHCLNMLRKATYPEYYEGHDSHDNHGHLDHCIETIREALMCNAGTGLVTFHWVKDVVAPYPDYNTWHNCRNPDAILQWALDNAVNVYAPILRAPDTFDTTAAPF